MPLRRERRSADWLAELNEATLAVEALPFVPAVGFVDVDSKASSSKAYATVTCCWDSSRGTFKRVKVGLSRKHPTHLEALCAPPREAAVAALSAAKSIAEQEAMTPHVRVWCTT